MTLEAAGSCLAPRVLLAFDDFSLAGRHLLQQLTVNGHDRQPAPPSPLSLPAQCADRVAVSHFMQGGKSWLSVVTVATATLKDAELWTLADALVQWLSASDVEALCVVASLHLPEAKPHSDALANVYQVTINGSTNHEPMDQVASMEPSWEIKDAFLARLLHFARVEQAFTTQLLAAKGYKPGRDCAGTRDAMTALAAALPLAVAGAAVDTQQAMEHAYKALASLAELRQQEQQFSLLYQ